MKFIGDIHADYGFYEKIISSTTDTIQLGDFGIGFDKPSEKVIDLMKTNNHSFIRGNHDDPSKCQTTPNWIPDGSLHSGVFCCGGAYSIDWEWRTENWDWWANEQLTYDEFYKIFDIYEKLKPEIVATHDCPRFISRNIWKNDLYSNRTQTMLEEMYNIHKPKMWIFGHHHVDFDETIQNTRFVCVNINSVFVP